MIITIRYRVVDGLTIPTIDVKQDVQRDNTTLSGYNSLREAIKNDVRAHVLSQYEDPRIKELYRQMRAESHKEPYNIPTKPAIPDRSR